MIFFLFEFKEGLFSHSAILFGIMDSAAISLGYSRERGFDSLIELYYLLAEVWYCLYGMPCGRRGQLTIFTKGGKYIASMCQSCQDLPSTFPSSALECTVETMKTTDAWF